MGYAEHMAALYRQGTIINQKHRISEEGEAITLFTIRMSHVYDNLTSGYCDGLYHVTTVNGKFAGAKRVYV